MEVNLHFMHRSNFTGEDRIPYDTHYLPVARPSGSICCAKRLSCRLVVQCEVRKDSAVDQVTNDIVLSQRSQLSGIATFQLSLGSAYIGLQARYLLWANALQVQINGAPLPF